MASVTLRNVYKVYDNSVTAVNDFNLTVNDGELLVLLGPSGCGKSSVLKMIAGLEDITRGELYIDDKLVNHVDTKEREIATVFPNYALFPHMTVYENMAFGLELRKVPKAEIHNRVMETAKSLDIEHLLNSKSKDLSHEHRQWAALSCAIVRKPKVILMDEPLSNLDAKLRVVMRTEIIKLHNRLHTTIIYVTNDQTEAMAMGTRIVVMKDGVIQQVDSPQNLYSHPENLFVAGFIGSPQMNFIPVTLVKERDSVFAVFEGSKVKIPEGKIQKLKDTSNLGGEVIMGIRPEALHDEEIFLHSVEDSIVKAYVDLVEQMGSETYLYLKVDGINLTARVDPRSTATAGETIRIALDPNRLHFFDKQSEESLMIE